MRLAWFLSKPCYAKEEKHEKNRNKAVCFGCDQAGGPENVQLDLALKENQAVQGVSRLLIVIPRLITGSLQCLSALCTCRTETTKSLRDLVGGLLE